MQNQSMDDHNQVDQLSEMTDNLGKNLTLESSFQLEHNSAADDDDDDDDVVYVIDDEDDDDDDGGEFEFSFAGEEVKSPVSAEELFDNGKIKPTIPYLAEEVPAVKKLFVVSAAAGEAADEGPYCVWSNEEATTASSVPEMSRKSNSTGFSRLWRVKDLLVRSNSDGKDSFVLLPGKESAEAVEKKKKKMMKVVNLRRIKVGGGKNNEGETSTSTSTSNVDVKNKEKAKKGKKTSMSVAYEALYGKKKGGEKSYLPYRVGFFTNTNGMTKNVHPY